MDELLLYVVKSLVKNPDDVEVREDSNSGQVDLLLTVNPEDMGIVIGKAGQTIKAIRKLLITKAIVDNVRVNLQLSEPEGYVKPEKSEKSEEPESSTESTELEKPVSDETESADSTSQAPLNDKDADPEAPTADTAE